MGESVASYMSHKDWAPQKMFQKKILSYQMQTATGSMIREWITDLTSLRTLFAKVGEKFPCLAWVIVADL